MKRCDSIAPPPCNERCERPAKHDGQHTAHKGNVSWDNVSAVKPVKPCAKCKGTGKVKRTGDPCNSCKGKGVVGGKRAPRKNWNKCFFTETEFNQHFR